MGRGRKRRRVVSDEEWEKDRDDHVPARLVVLSDKLGLSRLRPLARGGTLDSGGTGVRTGSPGLPGPRVDGAEVTVAPTEAASQAVALSSTRCGSVLLIGTSKADKAVAAHAKARAIAMLQCLFAEEMSKGGQHPNAAAANALRRLTYVTRRRKGFP